MSTTSEKYRQRGNEFFQKLKQDEHAAPVVRQGRFTEALKCYNQALSTSANNDERASAYKNLAALFAYEIRNTNQITIDKKMVDYHLKECIGSYGRAYEFGKIVKSMEWLSALRQQINELVSDCCACYLMAPANERLDILILIVGCFERTALEQLDSLANVYRILGQLTFEKAISRYKEEPQLIYECQPYLDRALYWACDSNAFQTNEISELRHSIWLHQCMYESSNARRVGIRMLEAHTNNDEHLDMDMIWDIIDKFRQAILLAKEHDIEGEARACHETAKVYQNVLKMNELAYTYHLRCVTLAQTLIPRNLTGRDWYMSSSSFIQQHRTRNIDEEEEFDKARKEKFYTELATDLQELNNAADKGAQHFIEYVYKKYPPRKEGVKMGSIGGDQLSDTTKKAITHYHPDAQIKYNDEKWTFLCGEITKHLNAKYTLLNC